MEKRQTRNTTLVLLESPHALSKITKNVETMYVQKSNARRNKMRIAKEATLGSMKRLKEKLDKVFPKGSTIIIEVDVSNYKTVEYKLYAPGIAQFDWKYFNTWESLVQFCFQLIGEKEGEKKHQSGLQPK
jgi:hypothetical protein